MGNGERGMGNRERVSILELELRTRTSPQNENLVRKILSAITVILYARSTCGLGAEGEKVHEV